MTGRFEGACKKFCVNSNTTQKSEYGHSEERTDELLKDYKGPDGNSGPVVGVHSAILLSSIRLDDTPLMVYIAPMSGKDLVKKLERAGWSLDRISSSHHIMKKGDATISVPVHANRDLPTGTLSKLLKETGLQ
jgi:predicted RNA binding protein YcfA (HicA-like mRNA interferase family)